MALDLGTLSGKIALDTSDFEKSVASAKATLSGWAKDAEKTASATGKTVSEGMGKGAEQGAKRTSDASQKAQQAYDKAAKAAEAASQRQDSAARRVDVAETKLTETRRRYVDGSSQVKAAEDRLISARQASTRADEQAVEAKKKATKASEEVAKAAVDEADAQKKTGASADQAATKSAGAMGRIRSAISSLSRRSNPFQAMPAQAKSAGDDSGRRFGSGFTTTAKSSVASFGSMFKASFLGNAASSAIGSGIGAIKSGLESGFGRLQSIDQATAKLTGLGNSANTTKEILNNALASVKGTAYGMGDAATVAASMTASGIKSGQDLQKTLSLVADTATISGRSITDIGQIFGSVAAKGKLQGDDLLQLTSSGVPVLQFLGKTMHKTSAEVSDLSSKGKISFADFQKAMQAGLGDSAKSSGDTFTGAMANVKAALGRLGASVMGGAFKQMPGAFKGLIGQIDAMGPAAERVGAKVSAGVGRAFDVIKGLYDLMAKGDFTGSLGKALGIEEDSPVVGTLLRLRQTFVDFGSSVKTAVQGVISAFGPMAAEAAKLAGGAALGALSAVMKILTPLFRTLGDSLKSHPVIWRTVAASILGAVVALKAMSTAVSAVSAIGGVVKTLGGAVTAFKKGSGAISSFNRAFHALGIAFRLNPIGLVITALGLLVAGFIYAYTHSERFRNIVNGALNGVKNAAMAVGRWFSGPFVNFFKGAWNGIKAGFSAIGGFFTGIWNGIKSVFTGGVNAVKGVWGALWTALTNSWGFKALQSIFSVGFRLIRLAFTLFIAGVKAIWNGLWTALKWAASGFMTTIRTIIAAGMWVIRNVIMPPLNAIKAVWNRVWGAIKGFTSRVWDGIKSAISRPLNVIKIFVAAFIGSIKRQWSNGFNRVKSIASAAMGAVKTGINKALGGIEGFFSKAVGWIGRVWGGLKDVAKKPIKFIINTVINGGLVKGWNWLAGKLGATPMDPLHVPGFRKGGPTGSGRDDEEKGVVHANEFVMDAPTTRKAGGPGAMERIRQGIRAGLWPVGAAGELAGGDSQNADQQLALPSSLTAKMPGLRSVIAAGPKDGDKGFGGAAGEAAARWGLARIGDAGWYRRCLAFVNRAWGRRIAGLNKATARISMNSVPRTMSGNPPAGSAVYWDTGGSAGHVALGVGDGTELSNDIVSPGIISRVAHETFAKKWGAKYMGWYSPDGSPAGADSGWLSKIRGFFGSAGSAVASLFGKFANPMDWLKDHMTGFLGKTGNIVEKVGNNPWVKLIAKVPGKLVSMMTDKVKKLFGASGTAGKTGNMESWRSMVAQALRITGIGGGKSDEDKWLRQIMSESSGNPNLVQSSALRDINVQRGDPARGLVQVPGVTWADFGRDQGPFLSNWMNPLKNLIVGMRAAFAQHGGAHWRNVIGFGHGYKDGTLSVLRDMFAPLSEDGRPEIVAGPQMGNLMKGSRVYNGDETEKILRLRTIAQPKRAVTPTAMTGAAITMADTLIVKDVDDALVGRMRIEGYGAGVDSAEDREQMMARIGA